MNHELSFISSIWEDYHVEKLDNNHWKCLWCNNKIQVINATKDLNGVLGIQGMHIMCCFTQTNKYRISRYKYLRHYKASKKNVIRNHFQKVNTSISGLQDITSEVIENNIHHNYGTRYLSNLSASSEISLFSTNSTI